MEQSKQQIILTPPPSKQYQFIDSGNGFRLERFGKNVIVRPDSSCVWRPHENATVWEKFDARFEKTTDGKQHWVTQKSFKSPWTFTIDSEVGNNKKVTLSLRLPSSTKNIGVYPEQAANWEWMMHNICSCRTKPNVLNLFGHTGGATLCAAAAGASVCHVDASQSAITWARNNQKLSNLNDAPIRWIVDDCAAFVARELRRGVRYDALILDPPSFGRDPKGNPFAFEKQIINLLSMCKRILVQDPLFVIFNGYSMGYSATVLRNILADFFPRQDIEFGELHVQENMSNRTLPCSIFARFSRN